MDFFLSCGFHSGIGEQIAKYVFDGDSGAAAAAQVNSSDFGVTATLKPHQIEGLSWLIRRYLIGVNVILGLIMDRRSWPWKKKSSDKSGADKAVAVSESVSVPASAGSQGDKAKQESYKKPNYVQISVESYSHLTGLEDQVKSYADQVKSYEDQVKSYEDQVKSYDEQVKRYEDQQLVYEDQIKNLEDEVKELNEQLSAAHSEMITKENLVKQHAKVAEEAVSGWEKAEAEAATLKNHLESVTLLKLTAEDRASHLDGALKECMRQIRSLKKEHEQKMHNQMSMLEEITDITKFTAVMDINFWGHVYMTYLSVPYLRRSKGKIIEIASSGSWLPVPRMSFYNASKAAVVSFYESLRMELGSDIGIMITTPGVIESEMSQGKIINKDGEMVVDQDLRDVEMSIMPIELATTCAMAIVEGACRGDGYLVEPRWIWTTAYWVGFLPEMVEWTSRWFLRAEPGVSPSDTPSKKLLDMPGMKNVLHPPSVGSSQIKE